MQRLRGFSLVEVTLALGVVGFALLAILGLLPIGTKSGAEAIDATRTGSIAQDVQNRLRASVTYATFSGGADVDSTFFYDREGVLLGNNPSGSAVYRVDATIHGTWGSASAPANLDESVLRPVTVQIRWPVNTSTGAVLGSNHANFSFHVRRP